MRVFLVVYIHTYIHTYIRLCQCMISVDNTLHYIGRSTIDEWTHQWQWYLDRLTLVDSCLLSARWNSQSIVSWTRSRLHGRKNKQEEKTNIIDFYLGFTRWSHHVSRRCLPSIKIKSWWNKPCHASINHCTRTIGPCFSCTPSIQWTCSHALFVLVYL
jgi:hypothetical protein